MSEESLSKYDPARNPAMRKRMLIMLAAVAILFGLIFAYKVFVNMMMGKFMATLKTPISTVSAMKIGYQDWQPQLKASGSVRAVHGVDVTTELAGLVQSIYFKPGANVKRGDLLIELNTEADLAQLRSLQAMADLAAITYKRDVAQYAAKAVAKAMVDSAAADLKTKQAQVAQQAATIAKKVIRAPFDGRLGISAVNPGQYLNTGDKIVTLQMLDPIFVDFFIPQQNLPQLNTNQPITLSTDTYPGQVFEGKISTIDPKVDPGTRNVQVEATLANPKLQLLPGMFGQVTIIVGSHKPNLTLPQTAISYNPYGDIAYVVNQTGKDKDGKPILTVTQKFVVVGETRGDQVAIKSGLKEGDLVVTAGQLKLKNGSRITINNSIVPANNPKPNPVDE